MIYFHDGLPVGKKALDSSHNIGVQTIDLQFIQQHDKDNLQDAHY